MGGAASYLCFVFVCCVCVIEWKPAATAAAAHHTDEGMWRRKREGKNEKKNENAHTKHRTHARNSLFTLIHKQNTKHTYRDERTQSHTHRHWHSRSWIVSYMFWYIAQLLQSRELLAKVYRMNQVSAEPTTCAFVWAKRSSLFSAEPKSTDFHFCLFWIFRWKIGCSWQSELWIYYNFWTENWNWFIELVSGQRDWSSVDI